MAIIVNSIGTGGGRDYLSVAAWAAALPANIVTSGNSYVGEVYNDGLLTSASNPANSITGHTTDATHTITLRAASGHGFKDDANVQTNALAFNQANGAAIQATNTHGSALSIGDDFVTVDGLQFQSTGGPATCINLTNTGRTNTFIKNCIVESNATGISAQRSNVQNCVVILKGTSGDGIKLTNSATGGKAEGNTVVRTSDRAAAGTGINYLYGAGSSCKNNAVFNFSTVGTNWPAAAAGNATDGAALPAGTGSTSVSYSSSFETTTATGRDFRLASGSPLADAGVTAGLTTDIVGTSRPQGSSYDVGAWELIASAAVSGSGALVLPSPIASGAGVLGVSGSGQGVAAAPSVAAAGTVPVTGSGALVLPAPVVVAQGRLDVSGAGIAVTPSPAAQGAGRLDVSGSGAVTLAAPVVAAVGGFSPPGVSGSGSLAVVAPSVSAQGKLGVSGTSQAAAPAPVAAGSGTYTPPPITGTGAAAAPAPTVLASGRLDVSGSGAFIAPAAIFAAIGSYTPAGITGLGSLTATAPRVSATGNNGVAGTGQAVVPAPAVLASGRLDVAGNAAAVSPSPGVQASGRLDVSGSAQVSVPIPKFTGAGAFAPPGISASGTLVAPMPSMSAAGRIGVSGSASAVVAAPQVASAGTFGPNTALRIDPELWIRAAPRRVQAWAGIRRVQIRPGVRVVSLMAGAG